MAGLSLLEDGLSLLRRVLSYDLLPSADDTYDIGSSAAEWKDLYVDGIAYIDTLGTSSHATIIDTATAKGTWTASGTWTIPAVTLSGAVSGNAQTLSNANITVGASRTLDVSAGTLTLADNQISGDKVEGGTIAAITITALTAGGDVTLGANLLKTTNLYLKQLTSTFLSIQAISDNTYTGLALGELDIEKSGGIIRSQSFDDAYCIIQTRDNAVGLVEIARMVGAVDPYFQIGRDDTGVALNAVTDMLVLQAGAGTGNAAANFGFGIPIQLSNAASEQEERASIDFVLTDATNASEDVEINFKLQIAGVAPAEVLSIVGTGLDLPTGKVVSVAGTQVVGARVVDARCDDAINSGDAITDGVIDALRDCLITHGLIAAA